MVGVGASAAIGVDVGLVRVLVVVGVCCVLIVVSFSVLFCIYDNVTNYYLLSSTCFRENKFKCIVVPQVRDTTTETMSTVQ